MFDLGKGGGGYLGQATLGRMIPVTKKTLANGVPCISLSQDRLKILTHPHVSGPTVALIPHGFPPGANELTATVATEHPEAHPIEYAMAVIDKGADPVSCLGSKPSKTPAAFSGWVVVKPSKSHQIKLSFDRCVDRHYDIVIATRLPPGALPHLGWAYWTNFLVGSSREQTQCKS
jgi:hypothetical protein